MAAVLLACASAAFFGALAVPLRFALRLSPDPDIGAVASILVALAVAAVFAAANAANESAVGLGDLAPFFLAGLIAPGASQILYTRAVRDAGPSRTAVIVGVAPVIAGLIAIVFLDEPLRIALAIGAALVVGGGIALASERIRPEHFRVAGAALALGSTALFATRDNIVRWLSTDTEVAPWLAASTTLVAGTVAVVSWIAFAQGARGLAGRIARGIPAFALPGLLFGLSYVALFEAYFRGRVTVVSPLVATESLWGVVLSALLVGRSELVGKRLVLGALLIVAGGALIGASR